MAKSKGLKEQMEEADNKKYYYDLPPIEEFVKIVKDLIGEAANERFNHNRK